MVGALGIGGVLIALISWWKDKPKAEAETGGIKWQTLSNEIDRQGRRNEKLEAKVDRITEQHEECERRCSALEAEVIKLNAVMQGRGEGLQHIQELISATNLQSHQELLDQIDRKTNGDVK